MVRRSSFSRPAATAPHSLEQHRDAGSFHAGVFVAQWLGDNGELVLIARDSHRRLLGEPMVIPHGADRLAASDEMWDRVAQAERPCKLLPP